jgi:hypothetical protein
VCGPVCAVAFDLSVHLLVIATLGRRNERNPAGLLGYLLRVAALATSHAAQDEDHRIVLVLLHAKLPALVA